MIKAVLAGMTDALLLLRNRFTVVATNVPFLTEIKFAPGLPVSSRRALLELSDDVATKVQVLFYADASDALRKALHE
jgi:hypothetical protein